MMRRFVDPVCGFTHLFGAFLAVSGLLALIMLAKHDLGLTMTYSIFGGSLVFVYSSSTALHRRTYACSPQKFAWLNRIDHAAIYTLIAGTYTPVVYYALSGEWRWWVLGSIWGMAIVGIIYKLLFLHQDGVGSTLYYVLMGIWGFIVIGPQLISKLSPAVFWLLLSGGLIYLFGAVIFALRWPNFRR